jgi:hypothetical protein
MCFIDVKRFDIAPEFIFSYIPRRRLKLSRNWYFMIDISCNFSCIIYLRCNLTPEGFAVREFLPLIFKNIFRETQVFFRFRAFSCRDKEALAKGHLSVISRCQNRIAAVWMHHPFCDTMSLTFFIISGGIDYGNRNLFGSGDIGTGDTSSGTGRGSARMARHRL